MIETLLAALGIAVCSALLVRMCLPGHRRSRLDHGLQRLWWRLRGAPAALRRTPPRRDTSAQDAERIAREAIERARRVDWQGNVGRPRQFKRPPAREEEE
jgi:hypothetical protein